MLVDISIAIKGPEEELAYLKHPNYISIIRRGNTLLETYTYNDRTKKYKLQKSFLKERSDHPYQDKHSY